MDRDPCVAYLSAWTRVAECGGGLVAGVADGERQKDLGEPRNNAKNPTQNKIRYVRKDVSLPPVEMQHWTRARVVLATRASHRRWSARGHSR
jgi:hypothetical protein